MSLLNKMKYSFISKAMDKETFTVVSFKGSEAVSKPYEFEILLVSEKRDIDPLLVLQNPAIFTIHRDEEDNVDFNGILIQFEESQEFNDYLFFKAVLAPKLWWLSLTHHNQVYLDLTIPEIMEDALKDGGLKPICDFDFNLNPNNIYKKLEYICQYDESHFNFVSRWAEREGLYYFFEQTSTGEKVIFTDTKLEHKDLLLGKNLIYDPQSGLASLHTKEVIQSFICKHNLLPQRVYLKDYNYLKPSQAMEGIADVDENGRGENYIYGVNFDSVNEGNRLAKIRAEALLCRKSIFQGESSVPFMVPGYTFDLNEHYKDVYNRKYLVTDVTHEGHQTGYLISGISGAVEHRDEEMFYSNTFTAIYSDEQFRPEHLSKKPKISGTLNAKVDASAETNGEHPELDGHGRYKIILPFDRSGRFGGKASAFVRMMQPSAGQNQGMHFPLHKGTEVLLTFIDGNPDRPIIAGAVPNPETSSVVKDGNQTKSVIATGKSPIDDHSAGAAQAQFGMEDDGTWETKTKSDDTDVDEQNQDNYLEFDDKSNEKRIKIRSEGNLWFEARERYGEYHAKNSPYPSPPEPEPSREDLLNKFDPNQGGTYNPTGMLDRHNNNDPQPNFFDDVFNKAHVRVSSFDTVNTQEGNVYDFGGYWVYNLGNSYIEDHLLQRPQQIDPTQPTEPAVPVEPTPLSAFPTPTPAQQDQYNADKAQYDLDKTQYDLDKAKYDTDLEQYNEDTAKEEHNINRAILNKDSIAEDLLDVGGPAWTEVNWAKACDSNASSGISNSDVKIGSTDDQWNDSSGSTNVWVEKKFGDSYDYSEGDAISVTKGSSLDIQHADKQIDIVFRKGGAIKSWEKKGSGTLKAKKTWDSKGRPTSEMTYGDGILDETTWNYFAKGEKDGDLPKLSQKTVDKNTGTTSVHTHCRDTGNLIGYSSKHQGDNATHSFNFNWANTAKASFDFSAGASFSMSFAAKSSLAINLSASLSITLDNPIYIPGLKINISTFSGGKADMSIFTGLFFKLQMGIALGLDIDLLEGGKFVLDPSKKLKFKMSGFEAVKAAAVKAEKAEVRLEKIEAELESCVLLFHEGLNINV